MFSKIFTPSFLVAVMTAGAISKPIPRNRLDLSLRTNSHSFNKWGGISSLDGFDNFYGVGNFDGSQHFSQTIVNEKQLVCHTQQIEVIQQRLVVLQEMAKRIITEQICEVETQTIVFEQFHSSLGGFSHDLRRQSGHHVGYDSSIASHFGNIVHSDGSLSTDNWGFSGYDVGSHTVVVGGSNWVDSTSPVSVSSAYSASHNAYVSLHPEYSSGISPSTVPTDVVPPNVVPSDVIPNAIPSDVTPAALPSDAVPSDISATNVSASAVSAPAVSASAVSASAVSAPAVSAPAVSASAVSASAVSAPAVSASAVSASAVSAPAVSAPAVSASAVSASAVSAPAVSAPAVSASAISASAASPTASTA